MQRPQDNAPPNELVAGKTGDFASDDESKASQSKSKARLRLFLILTTLVVALDQLSKLWINATRPQTVLLPGFLDLRYTENSGAIFGLFQSHATVFIAMSIVASVAILVFLYYFPPVSKAGAISFALILSGVVGNLIDRIRLHHVIDFISFHVHQLFQWPAFNIADAALVVGVFTLIYYFYKWGMSRKAHEHSLRPRS